MIPPTRHTASSVCCHQGGDCEVSRRGPADWRTATYIRLSGSWTPSRPCPPPHSFTPCNTELWHYAPPPPAPHIPTSPEPPQPPPHKLWPAPVTLCSTGLISTSSSIDCKLPLLTVCFFCTTHISAVLFYLTGLHSICHVPYATLSIYLFFFFLQCPHLYICIVCMYICLNCIYLYLNVYCQCLMLTVCTKGQRVTQFQFSVCMYCTCGRIDNKADLTWLEKVVYFMFILLSILK